MQVGDEVYWWTKRAGQDRALLHTGRIRELTDTHASVVALASAIRGFGVKTVAIDRLKPLSELDPAKRAASRFE